MSARALRVFVFGLGFSLLDAGAIVAVWLVAVLRFGEEKIDLDVFWASSM